MNVICPKCETVFAYSSKLSIDKKFKCSVCNHTWMHAVIDQKNQLANSLEKETSYKKIIILNVTIIILAVVVSFIFRSDFAIIDLYWKQIFIFLDKLIPIQ
ncbi:MAG: hypothetical protein CMP36_01310 [Rickettsiales bacterium]|nr:hypothetical protein [Rickettsiales bacterium]OUV82152.1 MAG: hypothetical protein CBC91_01750 [Rickettsiales bacterium TMED131]|tara:strand:+ start:3816 stop:4118 length:303 start_codon:yes stop_codon:yes gene_type:complete